MGVWWCMDEMNGLRLNIENEGDYKLDFTFVLRLYKLNLSHCSLIFNYLHMSELLLHYVVFFF